MPVWDKVVRLVIQICSRKCTIKLIEGTLLVTSGPVRKIQLNCVSQDTSNIHTFGLATKLVFKVVVDQIHKISWEWRKNPIKIRRNYESSQKDHAMIMLSVLFSNDDLALFLRIIIQPSLKIFDSNCSIMRSDYSHCSSRC